MRFILFFDKIGYLEQGILFIDCKQLALSYFRSFQIKQDILGILPLELFGIWWLGFRPELRLNRLIRLDRFLEFRLKIETRSSYPFLFRIVYLVLLILVIIHWNACVYFMLSKTIEPTEWVFPNKTADSSKLYFQYIYCYFWSTLMLTTIGEVNNPTNTFESIIMTLNFLTAIVLIATLVGNIGSVISNMSIEQDKFQHKVDSIKSLMKLRKVSKELDERVIKWFGYLLKNNQTIDESEILANLPEKLSIEIASYVHLQTLQKVHIFSDCEEALLRELVTKLKIQVYSPGDYVCRKGDIGKEMYIVKRGSLEVVNDDGSKVFVTLKAGSFFGELSILNILGIKTGNRRTANVRSVGYSDLLRLSKKDLWHVLQDYPENTRVLIEKGYSKLVKDNLLNEELTKKYTITELAELQIKSENVDVLEFEECKSELKLKRLEELDLKLEKKLNQFTSELDQVCKSIKQEIETTKDLFFRKIGITV